MSIFNTSKFFKLMLIAFVAVVFLIVATRQRIAQTVPLEDLDEGRAFLMELRENLTLTPSQDQPSLLGDYAGGGNDDVVEEPQEAFDDSMPGAYLKDAIPAPQNQSYCKFNYELPLDLVYKGMHYLYPPEQGKESPYRVLYNVTEAYATESISQVTYATHMTANFAYFIPELLKRWDGLITVAAFVPDLDSAFFVEQVTQFCYCEPQMHRVSVHMVTHKKMAFSKKDIYFERPKDCVIQDSTNIPILGDFDDTVVYPINVVRNVARTSALTKYVLLADVELMPSRGLAGDFLEMLRIFDKTEPKEVFVLPTFEVELGEAVPETKRQLQELLQARRAVYFHEVICHHCQRFPGIDQWMQSDNPEDVAMKPFTTVKRHDDMHRWEPFYIGTNQDPLFSEQLSWEGLQDKMTQNLEMCLQDYNYTVVDNAFLCHWPGIKREKLFDQQWRAAYIANNRAAYAEVVKRLQRRYEDIPGCRASFMVPENISEPA